MPPHLPLPAPLLASAFVTFLAISFVVVSLFMMLVVLIQKPKGGGLSGAFGGAGGGETSFVGARIGDFLTWLTVGCFVAFLFLAMLLTWNINPTENALKNARTTQTAAPASAGAPGSAGATGAGASGAAGSDGATSSPLGEDPIIEDEPMQEEPATTPTSTGATVPNSADTPAE